MDVPEDDDLLEPSDDPEPFFPAFCEPPVPPGSGIINGSLAVGLPAIIEPLYEPPPPDGVLVVDELTLPPPDPPEPPPLPPDPGYADDDVFGT